MMITTGCVIYLNARCAWHLYLMINKTRASVFDVTYYSQITSHRAMRMQIVTHCENGKTVISERGVIITKINKLFTFE